MNFIPQEVSLGICNLAWLPILCDMASPWCALCAEVATDTVTMQTLHAQGRCAPCLFYTRKKDGCRKGLDYAVTSCSSAKMTRAEKAFKLLYINL